MRIRSILIVAVIGCAAVTDTQQASARPPLLQGLGDFISGKKQPDPGLTLQAPFTNKDGMEMPTSKAMGLNYYYDADHQTVDDLSQPQKNEDEVGTWLTNTVSDIMSVKYTNYGEHLKDLTQKMSPDALQSYSQFMQDSNLLSQMQSNRFQLHAFVEERPLLVNKGVVDNRYHWLYVMPASLTLMPNNVTTYEQDSSYVNYRVQLRVQVGRALISDSAFGKVDTANENDLVIESWDVHKNPYGN